MYVNNWGAVFTQSFLNIWYGVANFIPMIVIAVIVFAIGWILAVLVEKIIEGIFKSLKIDSLLKGAGLEDVMKRTGYPLNSGRFVGVLVKWFIIVIFLVTSFNIVGLSEVNLFLSGIVLSYLPQVIIAVLVLMVAVIIADAMQKIVTASAHAGHVKSAHLLGTITKWAIWIFAIIVALNQLGIGTQIINLIVEGVIIGGALAFGLAFGLGGKDYASRVIEKTMHKLSDKE